MAIALKAIDRNLALERAGGSIDLAKELFNMLLRELPVYRETLREMHQAKEFDAIKEVVHKLNGSATYCGVPALKKAAESLESNLKKGELQAVEPGLQSVLAEIERVLDEGAKGL